MTTTVQHAHGGWPTLPHQYPFHPLEVLCGADIDHVAATLQCTRRSVHRYRELGLTWQQADELAVKAGMHPACVWGTWADDAITPLDWLYVWGGGSRADWLWRETRRGSVEMSHAGRTIR